MSRYKKCFLVIASIIMVLELWAVKSVMFETYRGLIETIIMVCMTCILIAVTTAMLVLVYNIMGIGIEDYKKYKALKLNSIK